MGAWGVRSFDNDTACDWAGDLVGGPDDLSAVERAIARAGAEAGPYLDARDAEQALAACEVIARLRGNAGYRDSYTEDVDRWVEAHRHLRPTPPMIDAAAAAIDRILAPVPELAGLWADAGDAIEAEWRADVDNLRRRVTS